MGHPDLAADDAVLAQAQHGFRALLRVHVAVDLTVHVQAALVAQIAVEAAVASYQGVDPHFALLVLTAEHVQSSLKDIAAMQGGIARESGAEALDSTEAGPNPCRTRRA